MACGASATAPPLASAWVPTACLDWPLQAAEAPWHSRLVIPPSKRLHRVWFYPTNAKRRGGVGGGGGAAFIETAVPADRPPTPDPSPPRAMRVEGGEVMTSSCVTHCAKQWTHGQRIQSRSESSPATASTGSTRDRRRRPIPVLKSMTFSAAWRCSCVVRRHRHPATSARFIDKSLDSRSGMSLAYVSCIQD